MTLEDFTTYAKVDPNTHISESANHVDFDCYCNEDARLYKDYGVDHFGDFEHKIDVNLVSTSGSYPRLQCYALTNDLDDLQGLTTAAKTFLVIFRYKSPSYNRLTLREVYEGDIYEDIYPDCALNTWYYLTITKTGTALTCKIYSDSDRTDLLDTLSLTLHADHKFRYLHVCQTYNLGQAYIGYGDIENLDLQEGGVAHSQTITDSLGLLDSVVPRGNFKKSVSDILGLLDSVSPRADYKQAITDILGLLDSISKVYSVHITISDILGLLDSVSSKADYKVTVTEMLGILDSISKTRQFWFQGVLYELTPDHGFKFRIVRVKDKD